MMHSIALKGEKSYDCDLVFVVDFSGSMGGEIASIIREIIAFPDLFRDYLKLKNKVLEKINVRVIFVSDLHFDGESRWMAKMDALNPDMRVVRDWMVATIRSGLRSGGDAPENIFDGIYEAYLTKWKSDPTRKGSRRIVIAITDNSSKWIESYSWKNYTPETIIAYIREQYKYRGGTFFGSHFMSKSPLDDKASEMYWKSWAFLRDKYSEFSIRNEGRLIYIGQLEEAFYEKKLAEAIPFAQFIPLDKNKFGLKEILEPLANSFSMGTYQRSPVMDYP